MASKISKSRSIIDCYFVPGNLAARSFAFRCLTVKCSFLNIDILFQNGSDDSIY